MDTATYASLAAIPWSVAESNRHPAIPEVELIPLDLSYISVQRTKSKSHALRGKVRTRLRELFTPPQREEPMSSDSIVVTQWNKPANLHPWDSVIFTPTGPLVYSWEIDR
jgi:hypothetical protein